MQVLKGVAGDGDGYLLIDDLVDTGRTAQAVRQLLPKAYFATLYAKPAGGRSWIPSSRSSSRRSGSTSPGTSSTASPRRSRTAGGSRPARLVILVIGNKNYSSWSLRPWIAMKVLGFPFDETSHFALHPWRKEEILSRSPAGKVPVLIDGATTVWDSLAILEYLAEKNPRLWPSQPASAPGRDRLRRRCTPAFRTCAHT